MYVWKSCLTCGEGEQPAEVGEQVMPLGSLKKLALAATMALMAVHMAHAGEFTTKFSGYGTLGVVKSSSEDAELTRSPIQYHGASDKYWDYGVDSRLGLQGTVGYEQFSVTGQLLTQRVGNSDIRPRVEWLFANYAATDWLDLRAGRMVLPLFLLSDSRNAGFASVWLRAPQEVYSLYPITGLDGIQAIARVPIGDSILTVQPSYGRTQGSYSLSLLDTTIDLKYRKLTSILLNWELGDWMLHFGKSKTELSPFVQPIRGLANFGGGPFPFYFAVNGQKTVDEYMANFGVAYDDGRMIAQAEYVTRTQDDAGAYENEGYYLMAGWRFGKFTPYYVYGQYEPNDDFGKTAGEIVGRSHTIGLRYDLTKTSSFKVQFERRDPVNLFVNKLPTSNTQPEFLVTPPSSSPPLWYEREAKKINAISIAYDFVF